MQEDEDKTINSCKYYNLLADQTGCNYFISFAAPYCQGMTTVLKPRMSIDGQGWLTETSQCLRDKISTVDRGLSCQEIEKAAYEHHTECYVDKGFCELSDRDKGRVLFYLKGEVFHLRSVETFLRIAALCYFNSGKPTVF